MEKFNYTTGVYAFNFLLNDACVRHEQPISNDDDDDDDTTPHYYYFDTVMSKNVPLPLTFRASFQAYIINVCVFVCADLCESLE